MKPGDFVEAWQPIEDPAGAKIARRSFGVLLEVDRIAPRCMAYKVGTGRGFYEWFCHARKRDWTPEDMKRAAMEDALALVGHDAPPIRREVEDALAALRTFRDMLYKAEDALEGAN